MQRFDASSGLLVAGQERENVGKTVAFPYYDPSSPVCRDFPSVCTQTFENYPDSGLSYRVFKGSSKIAEGKNMVEPLMEKKVFPSMVVQMLGVGEQTGALDTMLGKIADFYEEEVDVAVAALTSLLEPMLMVMVGAMVGTVLISMYLPIFDLAGKIKAE